MDEKQPTKRKSTRKSQNLSSITEEKSPRNNKLSKEQRKKIRELKNSLISEKTSWNKLEQNFLDRTYLVRYLIATSWDVEKSKARIFSTLKWREENNLDFLSCDNFKHHFEQAKNYHNGFDKKGRPLIVMRCSRDSAEDPAGKVGMTLYQIERSVRMNKNSADSEAQKMSWLVDLSGFKMFMLNSGHTKMTYDVVSSLNAHYPERLGHVLLVSVPMIFAGFWKIISHFIDPITKEKIIFVKDKEELLKYVDSQNLEVAYGGENTYEFNFEEYLHHLHSEEKVWMKENKKLKSHVDEFGQKEQ